MVVVTALNQKMIW